MALTSQQHLQAIQNLLHAQPAAQTSMLTPQDVQNLPGRLRVPLLEQLRQIMSTAAPAQGPSQWEYKTQTYSPSAPTHAGEPIGWTRMSGVANAGAPAGWHPSVATPTAMAGDPNLPAGYAPGGPAGTGVTPAPPGGPTITHAPGENLPPWYKTIPLGWLIENALKMVRDTGVGRQPKMP